jgi:flagellar basal body-associated protein FliL
MADEPVDQPQETTSPKLGKVKLVLKAIAIVLLIVGIEVVAAAYIFPTGQDTEALARELAAAKAGKADSSQPDKSERYPHIDEALGEFELGAFNVTKYNPETEKTLVIDFEIYAAVPTVEASEFHKIMESNRNRLREQVIIAVHAAETSDLTEAGLGLIKRTILDKTNRALGKPIVREILISKFNFVER